MRADAYAACDADSPGLGVQRSRTLDMVDQGIYKFSIELFKFYNMLYDFI